jgi:hypothetical protein
MPWNCRLLSPEQTRDYFDGKYEPQVGDMWYASWRLEDMPHWLSPEYYRDWAGKRPPIDIMLPSNEPWGTAQFCIDMRTTNDSNLGDHGWTVTGEAPNITLSPSINMKGVYHGWIQNGVVSEDCEGRKFARHP